MPDALLRALDVTIGRRVEGLLAGDYRSTLLGEGSELALVRPYVPGDDVRRIDWNVTARTSEPHVRVDLAERVLVTWLVLDTSVSMQFGTADRRKADVAEGVAIAVGHLGTRRGNRLGVVTFGDAHPRALPPKPGRLGLIGLLSTIRAERDDDGPQATRRLPGSETRSCEQGRSHDSARSWCSSRTSAGRATGSVRCSSSLPATTSSPSRSATPPRRRSRTPVCSGSSIRRPGASCASTRGAAKLRERFAAAAAAERADIERVFRNVGARHVVLSTSGDWLRTLVVYLRRSAS